MIRRLFLLLIVCMMLATAGAAQSSTLSDLSRDLSAIAKQATPATVQIEVERAAPHVSIPDVKGLEPALKMPKMPEMHTKSVGSGFVIDPDGYILTSRDVVSDAEKITVKFADGSSVPAELMGSDSITDSAVIKAEKTGLKALALGDSDALQSGMLVVTVNSQAGLDSSVSLGVVASTDREASPVAGPVMQISGTIGPGASGGAVLDAEGRVVGISFAMFSPTSRLGPWFSVPRIYVAPSQQGKKSADDADERALDLDIFRSLQSQLDAAGLNISPEDVIGGAKAAGAPPQTVDISRTSGSSGFAIPINTIKPILDQLKAGKPIEHAMLGMRLEQTAEGVKLYPSTGSPADKAGVKAGDVLVSANGRKFARTTGLTAYILAFKPGDNIDLVVRRDGKEIPVAVTAGSRADMEALFTTPRPPIAPVTPIKPPVRQTFSIDLENVGIAEVAKTLSEASGKSVVVLNPEKITGKVTIHLKSTTLDSALSSICGVLECKSSKSGDGYVIKPAK